ncbi:MAG: hypothetical protein J7K30_04585 [Deltaproteobacteria bacterium]|nr:hypothetical protein [Deltaproteobacteria bacterium]
MAKYYLWSYLIGSSTSKNLPTILLPMPLKTNEEERSDSLLIIDFDLGDNLLDKHRRSKLRACAKITLHFKRRCIPPGCVTKE